MNIVYKKSMKESMRTTNDIFNNLDFKYPKLFKQVFRDKLFGEISGESNLISSKIGKVNLLISLLYCLVIIIFKKQYKSAKCAQENLFNYNLLDNYQTEITYRKLNNPILGFKVLSYLIVLFKLKFNRKYKNTINNLIKEHQYNKELANAYKSYLQQLIHAVLVKKYYKYLIYFSNGSPSYGKYIYSEFNEIQHGVVHDSHPAVVPIAKPKGELILSKRFEMFKRYTKCTIVESKKSVLQRYGNLCICFPSLTPESENRVVEYVKSIFFDALFFYHPRSPNFDKNTSDVKYRIKILQKSSTVYIGISSAIIDMYELLGDNFYVVLTKQDCDKLEIVNISNAKKTLKDIYNVELDINNIILLER